MYVYLVHYRSCAQNISQNEYIMNPRAVIWGNPPSTNLTQPSLASLINFLSEKPQNLHSCFLRAGQQNRRTKVWVVSAVASTDERKNEVSRSARLKVHVWDACMGCRSEMHVWVQKWGKLESFTLHLVYNLGEHQFIQSDESLPVASLRR